MTETRRDFLKKGAVAGGLVWAAPVLTSVGSPAFAASPRCTCSGSGTGLSASGPVTIGPLGFSTGSQVCAASVDTTPEGLPLVVDVICGSFDSTTCTARASILDAT